MSVESLPQAEHPLSPPPRAPRRGAVRRIGRILSIGAAICLSILLGAWLTLQSGILPRLHLWKPDLERWAADSLGAPVRIGTLTATGGLWAPVLHLGHIEVGAPDQPDRLRIRQVDAELVPSSLLPRSLTDWRPTLQRLRVDGVQLDARRDRTGQLHVGPLAVAAGDGPSPGLEWLLGQQALELGDSQLRWTDALGLDQPVPLQAVRLRLARQGRQHTLEFTATPPAALAGPLRVRGEFQHPLLAAVGLGEDGDWRRWRGHLDVELPDADLNVLQRHVAELARTGTRIERGRAAFSGRLRVDRGHLSGGNLDLALQAVEARLGARLEALSLRRLDTRLAWQRGDPDADGQTDRFEAQGLRFETGDDLVWPAANLAVQLQRNGRADWHAGEIDASRLDLALMARLSRQLPLAGPLRKFIAQTRPTGVLRDLRYAWAGPLDTPTRYRYAGSADALGFDALPAPERPLETPGRPGLQQADLRFDGDERQGRATLAMRAGSLSFPGIFVEPRVAMEQLDAQVQWRVERPDSAGGWPSVQVQVSQARFANADGKGSLSGSWRTGPRPAAGSVTAPHGSGAYLPGQLDLQVRLDQGDARQVHRYLPVRLPETARHYVAEAVRGGTLHDVQARVQGDLADFPYGASRDGVFQIRGRVHDGELLYLPAHGRPGQSDWPAIQAIRGELQFDRQSLRIIDASGRMSQLGSGQFALEQVQARIQDFLLDPVLRLEGRGHGPLADGLEFVRRSPLDGWLGHALHDAHAGGEAVLQLALQLPLDGRTEVPRGERARGSVELRGNELRLTEGTPRLRAVQGRVQFSDAGFDFDGLQAEALGGTVQARGALPRDGEVRIVAHGRATADGLRNQRDMGWLAELGRHLDGASDYELTLGFPGGVPDVGLTTRLQGLAGRWPAPLAKPAAQAWPLRVSVGPSARPAGTVAEGARRWIRVDLAGSERLPPVHALYETEPGGGPAPDRVLRGLVRVGPAEAALPARGVLAALELDTLQVGPWLDWIDPQPAHDAPAGPTPGPAPERAAGVDLDSDLLPDRVTLRTAVLEVGARPFHDLRVQLAREAVPVPGRPEQRWSGSLEARETGGQFSWRATHDRPTSVQLRLRRLDLPAESTLAGGPTASTALAERGPTRLPSVDLDIEALQVRGLALGHLSLQGSHVDLDPKRDWQLRHFSLDNPDARLDATGRWHRPPVAPGSGQAGSSTDLDFRLQLRDGGRLLQRLGQADVLRGGAGEIAGQLRWDGAPTAFSASRTQGALHLDLARGRFLRADPGAARLLGVLSLQSLPRRLLFDFSDVTQEGFSFDSIQADVQVTAGVASTQNLRIQGVQAAIVSQGRADLTRETQDLLVRVVPDVNAGAASLAYALVNPAVGLGTLLGQLVLRDSLSEATTREFRISGPWTAPRVDELPRQRPAPGGTGPTGTASSP